MVTLRRWCKRHGTAYSEFGEIQIVREEVLPPQSDFNCGLAGGAVPAARIHIRCKSDT